MVATSWAHHAWGLTLTLTLTITTTSTSTITTTITITITITQVATSWARTLGLQRARSSAVAALHRDRVEPRLARHPHPHPHPHPGQVAALLYTEIVWSFAFDVLVFSTQPDVMQLGGAGLIIGGAAVNALAIGRTGGPRYNNVAADEDVDE